MSGAAEKCPSLATMGVHIHAPSGKEAVKSDHKVYPVMQKRDKY